MSQIALFHSVLGVRQGVADAAELLTAAGHDVTVVDQYDGLVFDDYEKASRFAEHVGYGPLMETAVAAVAGLADGFLVVGFSNGGGMAEFVATRRNVGGVVMIAGVLGLDLLGADAWPASTPAQIHYSDTDPFRNQETLDRVVTAIRDSGSTVECFDYPSVGHLFTDASLPDDYDEAATRLLWQRVTEFCASCR